MPEAGDSERDFWVGITAFGAMLGTGLYDLAEQGWWFGACYTIGGGGGLMWMSPAVRSQLGLLLPSRMVVSAAIAVTWLFLAANISVSVYNRWIAPAPSASAVDITQAKTQQAADDQKQITALQSDIQAVTKAKEAAERDSEAVKQQLAAVTKERDDAHQAVQPIPMLPPATLPSFSQTYHLGETKIRELRDEVFGIKNFLPPSIEMQMVDDPSARALSIELRRAFDLAGSNPSGPTLVHPQSPQDVGVMIRVGNMQMIPEAAKKLEAAIRKVTDVDPRFVVLDGLAPERFIVYVGPNPNG